MLEMAHWNGEVVYSHHKLNTFQWDLLLVEIFSCVMSVIMQ